MGLVKGVMARAAIHYWREELDLAVEDYEKAVERARELGDQRLTVDAVYGLATSLIGVDRGDEAGPLLEEARAGYTELGDLGGLADVVAGDAFAVMRERGFAGLASEFERCTELYEQAGRQIQATQALFAQAAVALTEDRLDDARVLARSGLVRGVDLSDVFLQTWGLEYAATIELMNDNVEVAALLVGAAEAVRERIGSGWGPQTFGVYDAKAMLVERFDEQRVEELIEPGRLIDLAEAVELALSETKDLMGEDDGSGV